MTSVEQKVRRVLKQSPAVVARADDSIYQRCLGHAERIVRNAVRWQDGSGRIIDPYEKKETNTATARFLGALGLQLLHGRCADLIEPCAAALTPALEDLYYRRARYWGEFIVKEALMAFIALKGKVPRSQSDQWTHLLADYDPETTYSRTLTNTPKPEALHNFVTFGIAGEALKQKYGLADNTAFMDKYIAQQLTRCDENGMYNDPHAPLVYDVTPRMNLSIAMWAGYHGAQYEKLSETLKRGGLSQLLYQSSIGEFPFGGRSSQQNFTEISFAIVCLYEARRWADTGDKAMAGAFMRAAALAMQAIEKYLLASPVFFNKNMFPPETQHGRQRSYGFYGVYSLLIASQIGFACRMADDTIPETTCPAECGGYVFQPATTFHKVFAACGGVHLEIDTNADFKYDATGLGRLHFAGCPAELCLSVPITATPDYLTCVPAAPDNIAIGPGWDGCWLAALAGETLRARCEILEQNAGRIRFNVDYEYESCAISELYEITAAGMELTVVQKNGYPLNLRVPLLASNGRDTSTITVLRDGFEVLFKGFVYGVRCLNDRVTARMETFDAPNRNGIYKVGRLTVADASLRCRFSVSKA